MQMNCKWTKKKKRTKYAGVESDRNIQNDKTKMERAKAKQRRLESNSVFAFATA